MSEALSYVGKLKLTPVVRVGQMDALNLQLGVPRVDAFVRKDFEAFKAQKAAESGARPIDGPGRTCALPPWAHAGVLDKGPQLQGASSQVCCRLQSMW